jgi:dTDP-4-amino-4,6-dideoxygalactose transaminase
MLFLLVLRRGSKRELVNHLEANGVETRDLLPLLNQPVYRKLFGDLEPHFPVARWLNEAGFYIGCHQYLTDEAVDYVADRLYEFFGRKSPAGTGGRRRKRATVETPVSS